MQRWNRTWTKAAVAWAALAALSCGGGGGGSSGFIRLNFETSVTGSQRKAFTDAAARIGKIVTSILGDVKFLGGETCGAGTGVEYPVPSSVKGLLIFVEVKAIDGPNGVLAASGPCYARKSSRLPVVGIMSFDVADLDTIEQKGLLDAVVLHEMLHVVGFGTIWPDKGLLDRDTCSADSCPLVSDPKFLGAGAIDAYKNFNGGTTDTVPVENQGGAGTALSHWRDVVFRNELMTGYVSGTTQPLSRTSIASLADLGYQVDLSQADPFDLATASNARALAGGTTEEPSVFLGQDTLPAPPRTVDDAP